jgi:hypothetical protein
MFLNVLQILQQHTAVIYTRVLVTRPSEIYCGFDVTEDHTTTVYMNPV